MKAETYSANLPVNATRVLQIDVSVATPRGRDLWKSSGKRPEEVGKERATSDVTRSRFTTWQSFRGSFFSVENLGEVFAERIWLPSV